MTDEPDYPDIVDADTPGLYVVDADGKDLRLLARDAIESRTWWPDGTTIAYIAEDGSVATIAPDGSAQRTVLGAAVRTGRAEPDFSPDGTRLVITQRRKRLLRVRRADRRYTQRQIAIVDLTVGTVRRLPAAVTIFAADAAWSPDGSRIAYVTYNTPLRLFTVRADGTGKRLVRKGRRWGFYDVAWQAVPTPARAARLDCETAGRTVRANNVARVFVIRQRSARIYHGCSRDTGRVVRLIRISPGDDYFEHLRLTGRFFAAEYWYLDFHQGVVVVWSVRRARQIWDGAAAEDTFIDDLEVTRRGAVAWLDDSGFVEKCDRNGRAEIGHDASKLRRIGRTVSWRTHNQRRSYLLRGRTRCR